MTRLTIALDAMGGDFGPLVTVPASVQALLYYPSLKIILIGDQKLITQQLSSLGFSDTSRYSIIHTDTSINNEMRLSQALRLSKGSSMRIALELVAQGEADACVSGGNTGALIALSRSLLPHPLIHRPALVSELPTLMGHKRWLLDLGANVTIDAETLFQFAIMGAVLAEMKLNRPPNVGLLNVGEEENKGNELVKRCAEMLKQCEHINYVGYIEGNQVFTGKADVVVCDGFVGNITLKTSEGIARLFIKNIKQNIAKSFFRKLVSKWLFGDLIKQVNNLNPDQYNGATLLGLRGIVVKSHGSADIPAFKYAIVEALNKVEQQLTKKVHDRLEAVLLERH